MIPLLQKLSPLWWTRNPRYTIYFLREVTGPLIAFFILYFLIAGLFDPTLSFMKDAAFKAASWIGLGAALIHTLTWFWVTARLISQRRTYKILFFTFLLVLWVGVSSAFLYFFYEFDFAIGPIIVR